MRGNKTPISNTTALYLLMTTQQAEITKFKIQANKKKKRKQILTMLSLLLSLLSDSNQRPRDYKSRALAN